MVKLGFVDCETTGLHVEQHEIWEVALILRDDHGHEVRNHWFLPVNVADADPMALKIGGFHERHPYGYAVEDSDNGVTSRIQFADDFARLTYGVHLVGAVVSFDDKRLERLLQLQEELPSWHYHIVDVEALAAGFLMGKFPHDGKPALLPWHSEDLSRAMGVNPDDYERHTAMGDAEWAKDIYDRVFRGWL